MGAQRVAGDGMPPCKSKLILVVCDKEKVLESVEHIPMVREEASF